MYVTLVYWILYWILSHIMHHDSDRPTSFAELLQAPAVVAAVGIPRDQVLAWLHADGHGAELTTGPQLVQRARNIGAANGGVGLPTMLVDWPRLSPEEMTGTEPLMAWPARESVHMVVCMGIEGPAPYCPFDFLAYPRHTCPHLGAPCTRSLLVFDRKRDAYYWVDPVGEDE